MHFFTGRTESLFNLIESGLKAAVCLVEWYMSHVQCVCACMRFFFFFLGNPYKVNTLIEIRGSEENDYSGYPTTTLYIIPLFTRLLT